MSNVSFIKNSEKFVVSQSNDLIEAHYPTTMTARAHKTARLVLSLISPDDKDLRTYTVKIDSLKRYLGLKQNVKWGAFYKELKDIQDKLNEQPIEIKKPNGRGYIRTPFLGLDVSPDKGTVTFEISGLLKPYLLALKANYTSYLLANIPKLKSSYSIRLYELLHQYRKIGKRYIMVEELQKKVGSAYPKYSNFKIKVLKQAQKDLKAHTDLSFAFNEHKESRKIVAIEFIIFGNTPTKKESNQLSFLEDAIEIDNDREKPAFSENLIKAMSGLGISEQNIAKYLALGFNIIGGENKKGVDARKRCGTLENYYLEKLELTKNSSNQENAAGYFIKALKEDWINSKALKKANQEAAAKKIRETRKKLTAIELRIKQLSQLKEAKKTPVMTKLLEGEEVLQAAYHDALAQMGSFIKKHNANVLHLPIREQYEKSLTISNGMNIYVMEKYPEYFKEVVAITAEIEKAEQEIKALKRQYPYLT